MKTTRNSGALLAALVIGAAPLVAQAANDNPNAEPPPGGRIPAASDTQQHSGDTSSDQSSRAPERDQVTPSATGDASATGASETNRDRPRKSEAEQNQGQGKSSGSTGR
jgi:hypothetical protein